MHQGTGMFQNATSLQRLKWSKALRTLLQLEHIQ